jgi:hypothetical protein
MTAECWQCRCDSLWPKGINIFEIKFTPDKMYQRYIGPQSFINERAVNQREKYLYGYGGYYGATDASTDPSAYQTLYTQPLQCDALKQDCWSKPHVTPIHFEVRNEKAGHNCHAKVEGFDPNDVTSPITGVGNILGVIGIAAIVIFICKRS